LDEDSKIQTKDVRFLYRGLGDEADGRGEIHASEEGLKGLSPPVMGNTAVPDEIKSGHDKRFEDLRADPVLSRFYSSKAIREKVTVKQALTFAKKLIQVTSERTHLI